MCLCVVSSVQPTTHTNLLLDNIYFTDMCNRSYIVSFSYIVPNIRFRFHNNVRV